MKLRRRDLKSSARDFEVSLRVFLACCLRTSTSTSVSLGISSLSGGRPAGQEGDEGRSRSICSSRSTITVVIADLAAAIAMHRQNLRHMELPVWQVIVVSVHVLPMY